MRENEMPTSVVAEIGTKKVCEDKYFHRFIITQTAKKSIVFCKFLCKGGDFYE